MDPKIRNALLAGLGAITVAKLIDDKTHIVHDLSISKRLGAAKNDLVEFQTSLKQVVDMWYNSYNRFPKKEALIFEDQVLTFTDLEKASNKVANWALKQGFPRDACIALDMENRTEFVITWLGLSKAGYGIAWLNFNVKLRSLEHSIAVADCVALIFGSELSETIGEIADSLKMKGVKLYSFAGTTEKWVHPVLPGVPSIDEVWNSLPDTPVPQSVRAHRGGVGLFAYIYTSGTTGLPKACKVTHSKYAQYCDMFMLFCGTSNDRVYTCLPLYHTAGGGLGIGTMIKMGCTVVLARKFSARKFWVDCKKHNVTAIQYIGELCRYLLASPKTPEENTHCVRIAYGNGLRPEIWDQFQRRFNVIEIGEFYGATEGNGGLVNLCRNYQGQGAVGRSGSLLKKLAGMAIIKFDVESEMPIRGSDGFCRECDYDEAGELVFKITDLGPGRFEGYSDPAATAKKVAKDVFTKGDNYFRTGDLLKSDSKGYYYFVDRIGDTFRWKGENVSTMEVSEVLCSYPGLVEANVYGVAVPGQDGRACMAAIVMDKDAKALEPKHFTDFVSKQLPAYSVPLFIRFLPEVEVTGTFKHKKVELRDQGFHNVGSDLVWEFDTTEKIYKILQPARVRQILAVKSKL